MSRPLLPRLCLPRSRLPSSAVPWMGPLPSIPTIPSTSANVRGRALFSVGDALCDSGPVQHVFRPSIDSSGDDTEQVLHHRQCRHGPMVSFHLRHRYEQGRRKAPCAGDRGCAIVRPDSANFTSETSSRLRIGKQVLKSRESFQNSPPHRQGQSVPRRCPESLHANPHRWPAPMALNDSIAAWTNIGLVLITLPFSNLHQIGFQDDALAAHIQTLIGQQAPEPSHIGPVYTRADGRWKLKISPVRRIPASWICVRFGAASASATAPAEAITLLRSKHVAGTVHRNALFPRAAELASDPSAVSRTSRYGGAGETGGANGAPCAPKPSCSQLTASAERLSRRSRRAVSKERCSRSSGTPLQRKKRQSGHLRI